VLLLLGAFHRDNATTTSGTKVTVTPTSGAIALAAAQRAERHYLSGGSIGGGCGGEVANGCGNGGAAAYQAGTAPGAGH
jgi:hypothetical protein